MAFSEFRTPFNSPLKPIFDIERFAYDVFAYMLRICGFPEEKIPTSSLRRNDYNEVDFVRNVGLSALPISLYMRDEWRTMFEKISDKNGIGDICAINDYLRSYLASAETEEEDTIIKIQFSLALYNEYILYLNFGVTESNFDIWPKLWGYLCIQFQKEDGEQTLESMLTMCPDISESWIIDFIRRFAIPYGSLDNVSETFCVYTISCHDGHDPLSEETSTNGVSDSIPEDYDDPDKSEDTITHSLEGSKWELSHIPHKSDKSEDTITHSLEGSKWELSHIPHKSSADSSYDQQEIKCLETIVHNRCRNGLFYVLNRCLKGRKRTRSLDLDVDNAFANINLEKENISPEQHNTKRRRKISGKDKLE